MARHDAVLVRREENRRSPKLLGSAPGRWAHGDALTARRRRRPRTPVVYADHPPWADRTGAEVRELLANTDEAVGLREAAGALVAAARVLTDYREYGMVYDVVVADDRRGEGLGVRLMEAVASHSALDDVHLALHCREDLVPFYERCGFTPHDRDVELPNGETMTYRIVARED
ncbi:GNAT family N-acetyltransferase [Halomicrococcus gelatinilyticus]|uniref:GNAT family N-acetyltransferase n=1 Tax=Halomicrococcus gelatinilyticus TaxID=1702103 RepID=UPI002E15E83C